MSEISDEGLLPPNVHHARPDRPASPDEEADRERVETDDEEDHGDSAGDDAARRPPIDVPRERRNGTDDPYATDGEDPYAAAPSGAPAPEHAASEDGGRVDGRTGTDSSEDDRASEHEDDATVGTGTSGTGAVCTAEPPD